MSIFSSYKKIFLLGFILVILIAIPFSVYIAQQRQNISSKAAKSTTLSFKPVSKTAKVGDTVGLDIILDPGTNLVSFAKLTIKFDASKFTATSLEPNTEGNALQEKIDVAQLNNGTASISLSIGADPAKAIAKETAIATLQLKAIAATGSSGSNVTFDTTSDNTQVLSIKDVDGTSENVLLSAAASATIVVTANAATPTPTASPGASPTATPTGMPTPTPTAVPVNAQQPVQNPIVFVTPTPMVVQPTPTTAVLPPEIVLPPTGPGGKILGIGAFGVILTIIGGTLLFL